ncbi:MAG: hypothetical protein AMJ75_12700 [Phycisphaerae bacterium SM1_79]|nr:MAG: hypothetical protein AMJ75_12700 [Phycisphaerae bacterium SM1_79]
MMMLDLIQMTVLRTLPVLANALVAGVPSLQHMINVRQIHMLMALVQWMWMDVRMLHIANAILSSSALHRLALNGIVCLILK